MPAFRAPLLRSADSRGTRIVACAAAAVALVGAAWFYSLTSAAVMSAPPGTAAGSAAPLPLVRFQLGADLWSLFDVSVQDRFGHPFPHYAIDLLGSRNLIEIPPRPYPREIDIVVPAEKFLADEFVRASASHPDLTIQAGPDLGATHLALIMSPKTHRELTALSTPTTLLDWLRACGASPSAAEPTRFVMANPVTCSSSWLALADLVTERLPTPGATLADATPDELSAAVSELKEQIVVEGTSDRMEMYRYLFSGCPDHRVLLVYGHLADLAAATGAFPAFDVVIPQLRFQPIIPSIIVTRRVDHLETALYLPTVLADFRRSLPQNSAPPATLGSATAVPDYAAMTALLGTWTGGEKRLPGE